MCPVAWHCFYGSPWSWLSSGPVSAARKWVLQYKWSLSPYCLCCSRLYFLGSVGMWDPPSTTNNAWFIVTDWYPWVNPQESIPCNAEVFVIPMPLIQHSVFPLTGWISLIAKLSWSHPLLSALPCLQAFHLPECVVQMEWHSGIPTSLPPLGLNAEKEVGHCSVREAVKGFTFREASITCFADQGLATWEIVWRAVPGPQPQRLCLWVNVRLTLSENPC